MNKRQELNKAKLYHAYVNAPKSEDFLFYAVIIGELLHEDPTLMNYFEDFLFYAVIIGELLHEDPTLMNYFVEVTCDGDDVKTIATKRVLTSLFDNLELHKRDLVAANIAGDKCAVVKRAGQKPDLDAIYKEAQREYDEAD